MDDVDHNPRTLRSLPMSAYRRPARRSFWRSRRAELWAAVLGLASLTAMLYWLRLPH